MNDKKERFLTLTAGLAVGFVNGFFGGGGGMILVPVLTGLLKKETKTAHATAIAVILPVTVISALVYSFGVGYELSTGLPVTAGVVLGGVIGAALLSKLNPTVIKWIFGIMMFAAGLKLAVF